MRGLRSCLLCKLIKTFDQFKTDGCNNCEDILHIKGSSERVSECTTPSFTGTCAMFNPSKSWVSKWQRSDQVQPGIYALKVFGRLPEEILEDLERLEI
jgi:transcription elongation factor SPT4